MTVRCVALLAVLLLAGCSQAPSGGETVDLVAAGDALHGAVFDPALRPLVGATVAIQGSNATALADSQGVYSFPELARGVVLIVTATAAGYTTASRQVTLPETGDTRLDLVLDPLVTQGAYVDVLKFDGLIGCQVAVVVGEGEPTAEDCGSAADPADSGRTVWEFSSAPKLASAVVEVTWEPTTDLAQGLGARLDRIGENNGTALSETVGRSPLRLVVPVQAAQRSFANGGSIRLTVYAMPVTDEDEQAAAVAVAANQPFQAFASLFYGVPPDPTYSFVNGS